MRNRYLSNRTTYNYKLKKMEKLEVFQKLNSFLGSLLIIKLDSYNQIWVILISEFNAFKLAELKNALLYTLKCRLGNIFQIPKYLFFFPARYNNTFLVFHL